MFSRRAYLFGPLQVDDDLGLRRLNGEKMQSLLAYLVLHPRFPHRREMLADLLSPDALPQRVRRNFSDTLYRLQKVLSYWRKSFLDQRMAGRSDPFPGSTS
jgi:DNA-binding SARP family transcriptional activator